MSIIFAVVGSFLVWSASLGPWAGSMAIPEVLSFLFISSAGLTFGVICFQAPFFTDHMTLIEALRAEAEDAPSQYLAGKEVNLDRRQKPT